MDVVKFNEDEIKEVVGFVKMLFFLLGKFKVGNFFVKKNLFVKKKDMVVVE